MPDITSYYNQIFLESIEATNIKLNESELKKYLGTKSGKDFDEISLKVKSFSDELLKAVRLKACWRVVKLQRDENVIVFDGIRAESSDLSKNLLNCDFAIIFCATLGVDADRIIKKRMALSFADGFIMNSIYSAYVESWCDVLNEKFADIFGKLRPRFSCGYGDFDISHQRDMLNILEAGKKIGVYCTESLMLTPSKSVTAVIGIMKG